MHKVHMTLKHAYTLTNYQLSSYSGDFWKYWWSKCVAILFVAMRSPGVFDH